MVGEEKEENESKKYIASIEFGPTGNKVIIVGC